MAHLELIGLLDDHLQAAVLSQDGLPHLSYPPGLLPLCAHLPLRSLCGVGGGGKEVKLKVTQIFTEEPTMDCESAGYVELMKYVPKSVLYFLTQCGTGPCGGVRGKTYYDVFIKPNKVFLLWLQL